MSDLPARFAERTRRVRSFFVRWFRDLAEADTRTLSIFRIVHGLCLAIYVAWTPLFGRLEACFTDRGALPYSVLEALEPLHAPFTLFRFVHTDTDARAAFVVGTFVCLVYAAGGLTKLTSILAYLVVVSIHHRVPFAVSGAMAILDSIGLIAVFLPLGRHYSIDALMASRRGDPPGPIRIRSIAMLTLHVQLFAIYLFNVIHKHGDTWMDGTAVHYALANTQFAWATGVFVARHAPTWLIAAMTYATLAAEGTIALAVISPWRRRICRRYAAVAIVALHVGFALLLNVGPFLLGLVPAAVLLLAAEVRAPKAAEEPRATTTIRVRELAAVGLLALILLLNRRDNGAMKVALGPLEFPELANRVVAALYIPQRWSMFSSDPMTDEYLLMFVVELEDGRMLDARTRRSVDFDRTDGRPLDPDAYWQLLDPMFSRTRHEPVYAALARYVASRPAEERWPGSPRVRRVEIHQITSRIPGSQTTEPRQLGSVVLYDKTFLPHELPGLVVH